MIIVDENKSKIHILNEIVSSDLFVSNKSKGNLSSIDLMRIQKLKLSGCTIDNFDFLHSIPNLQMLYFLACKSDVWQTLQGTPEIISLGLHNMKQGKCYLAETTFLQTFPNLRYFYVNMIGVRQLLELPSLTKLNTVIGSFRNENTKKDQYNFSSFQNIPNLKIFNGYAPVDHYRIPAENFIPILKNKSLVSFSYSQMFTVEDKKLNQFIREYNPKLLDTILSLDEIMQMRREKFAD